MKNLLQNLPEKIKESFIQCNKGKENINIIFWGWGVAVYVLAFFIYKLLITINIQFITWVISIAFIIYFVWHVISVKRCSPKKPKLTKKEKEELKKDRWNRIGRKLLLKEPISKWNSSTTIIAIDILAIISFFENLL